MNTFKLLVTVLVIFFCVVSLSHIAIAINAPAMPTQPLLTNDPILDYMHAAGFPAWAGVVAYGVIKLVNELRSIGDKLEAHIIGTERRLSLLEFKVIENGKNIL